MLLKIDRSNPKPLYLQIIDEIKSSIDEGRVLTDQPLPSTRSLAKKLGVNRSTVVQAYEELNALGYIRCNQGSYSRVQHRLPEAEYTPGRKSLIDWEKASNDSARKLYKTFLRYSPELPLQTLLAIDAINISQLDIDHRVYPLDEFRKCVNRVLLDYGSESLQYGAYKGYRPLREYIARHLRLHEISTSGEEILITNGAQQGIDLLTRLLAGPSKKVVIETPTYANIIPLMQFSGAQIIGIPMNDDGMDLEYLDRVLSRENVSFVYTIPNSQNPTGITTNHQHREKLLNICQSRKAPLVEDGFEEDMKYYGKVPLPIKSIDEKNIVIYLGTLSKALFPGLRIGWVTADRECIDRLTAIKRFSDLSSGTLVQIVLFEFMKRGYYDLQLKRMHRIFRRRMKLALDTMEDCFPEEVSWTRPTGGYTIWVKIKGKLKENQLHNYLSDYGVVVSPGIYYFPEEKSSEYFRISIAKLNEEEIQEGLTRLGRALHSLIR
jgi:DNA-binding transcriptional MocR family regulator